jgi:hypothetical protein
MMNREFQLFEELQMKRQNCELMCDGQYHRKLMFNMEDIISRFNRN